jgi:Phage terminase, small subunit
MRWQSSNRSHRSALLIKTPNGYPQQSPLLSIVNGQSEIVSRMLREFGLTPASRSRINAVDETPVVDDLEMKLC